MKHNNVDISIDGIWFSVPSLEVNGNIIAIKGKWLKVAVIHDEGFLETEFQDPGPCIERLKERRSHGLRADIFTFTQKLPAIVPRFSYPMEWESVAAVRTSSFKEWWDKLAQEGRKNVRRAEKRGVAVIVKQLDDDLVRDIVELNNDSPVRQGKPFVHYGKSFEQVKRDQAAFPGRSDYVCAYVGKELIGFLKMVYRGEVASLVQILPKASHQDKRPANALVARAVELCEAKGVSYLTYGLFNYGAKRDSSLRDFKSRTGFEEILAPRFYVPLTWKGAVAVKLKLHLGLHGILPGNVIAMIANTRAKWYTKTKFYKPA